MLLKNAPYIQTSTNLINLIAICSYAAYASHEKRGEKNETNRVDEVLQMIIFISLLTFRSDLSIGSAMNQLNTIILSIIVYVKLIENNFSM